MTRNRGFTLLELLVALSIFGLVSVMAFSGLDAALSARESTERQAERLIQLHKAFNLMREDFEQAVNRPVRDQLGDRDDKSALVAFEGAVVFTRGGRPNPLNLPRSSLDRVGWGLKDGKLMRSRWRSLDQPMEPEVGEYDLLDKVKRLQFRYLAADKRWIEQWPPVNQTNPQGLPHAVEVTLELEDLGSLTRIFVLPF